MIAEKYLHGTSSLVQVLTVLVDGVMLLAVFGIQPTAKLIHSYAWAGLVLTMIGLVHMIVTMFVEKWIPSPYDTFKNCESTLQTLNEHFLIDIFRYLLARNQPKSEPPDLLYGFRTQARQTPPTFC